jgi:hypothetical protein
MEKINNGTPPVLLIIFNRPDTTKKVFEVIEKIKPKQLFIAADGPRSNKKDDLEKCLLTRKITENINWDCSVKRLYRKKNFGCGDGPATAITWFFKNVESGIVLEDDCIPDLTFFKFCGELLERYKDDERVMMISGDNFQSGFRINDDSYYFSRHFHCWGWASWRRAWDKFDNNMIGWKQFKKENRINDLFNGDKIVSQYWKMIFDSVAGGNREIWDYQWTFSCLSNNGLCIIPDRNLVTNIGVGPEATHTKRKSDSINLITKGMAFPLNHPKYILASNIYDKNTDYSHFVTIRTIIGLLLRLVTRR